MKSVNDTLNDLAERAAVNGQVVTFVSGQTRIDVEWIRDVAITSWRLNGKTASRESVELALERARAHKPYVTV